MIDIELNGNQYRIAKLSGLLQGQLARRISPLVPKAVPAIRAFYEMHQRTAASGAEISLEDVFGAADSISPLADALADLKDETFEQVVLLCMSVTQRQQGTSWAAVSRNGAMMFSDMEFDTILPLVVQAVQYNLGNFIRGLVSQGLAIQTPAPQTVG